MLSDFTSARNFRDRFDAGEILKNPRLFLHIASTLDFTPDERACIRLFEAAFDRRAGAVVRCDGGTTVYEADGERCPARYTQPLAAELLAGEYPPAERSLWIGVAALCEAARRPLESVGEAARLIGRCCRLAETPADGCDDVVEVRHTADPWRFRLWTPGDGSPDPIRTVRIVDADHSALGSARIVIEAPSGRILRSLRMQRGESLLAHFRGGRLVELLPRMSVSSSHCTFVRRTDAGDRLFRMRFYRSEEFEYAPELGAVSQFAADDNGGFAAIRNRELILFSNLFHRADFAFEYGPGEFPVEVALRGEEFVVLSNRGRTRSNCGLDREGILSIGFSASHIAYALTEAGELVTNRDCGCDADGFAIAEVCSLDEGVVLLRGRDGALHASIDLEELGLPKTCEALNRARIYDGIGYWLSDEGKLFRQDEPIAENISDFDIVRGRLVALDNHGVRIINK